MSLSMATTETQLRLAKRMSLLGTETAFEVLVRARALERQGRSIVHLEIGEPDQDTPGNIVEAAVDALHQGHTHYGPSAGLPELRQAIADDVSKSRGITVTPEEVVVVPGGKPIIFFTILSLVDAGDEVIYPNPGFPIYESMINFVGGKAVPIPLRENREFRLDVNELAGLITDRTKMIILNSPQNPTGGVMTKQDVADVAAAIGDREIMVLDRRDLPPPAVRRRALQHRRDRAACGPHHYSGRLLQDLRHDRLAHGLRRDAPRSGGAYGAADDQLQLLHRQLYAKGRHRGAARRSERAGEDAPAIPAAARCLCEGHQPDQRFLVPVAERRVLHLPEHSSRRAGRRRSWPMPCWRKPAWRHCRARPSENTARVICGSAWRIPSRTSRPRSIASINGRRRSCRFDADLRVGLRNM